MKLSIYATALACCLSGGTGANAAQYVFSMSGRISYIANTQYGEGGAQPLDVTTALKLSDAVTITGLFDTDDYPQFNPGDVDPTFGYYFGGFREISYQLGGYNYSSSAGQESFGSITTTNDRSLEGVSARYDGWSISNLMNVTGQRMPVDLGEGRTLVTFGFNAYDFTGNARRTDAVDEPLDLGAYSSKSGSVSFYNTGLSRFSTYLLDGIIVNASPVPEPTTWAMMILGMGAVGFAVRRSRKSKVNTTVSFA